MPLPAEPFVIGRWSRYKRLSHQHRGGGLLGAFPADRPARRCVLHGQPGQHLPQGVAAHARQDAEPGRATVTLDEQPNHRAAVLLTPEAIRAEASVARSGCWPTGSSPTPIIPTRPRVRSAAAWPAARHRGSASRRDGGAERQRALLPLRPATTGQGPDRCPGGSRRRPHANLRGPAYYH
jgi:hypothetical protein